MPLKAMELFDAYNKNNLPKEEGYIVSSFFSTNSAYSRYEIVSYNNVKSIYPQDNGLTFHTDGKKLFILVEPANYPTKGTEPYVRSSSEAIPLRFSELDTNITKNQTRVMIATKPVMSYGSFTILKPEGINVALVFYKLPDMYETMQLFFERTFNKEAGIPMTDAKKCAAKVASSVKTLMQWEFTSS